MPKVVDHQVMRDHLAAIVCRSISQNGLENTTMRGLAKLAGCTTGLITHYFPNKNALLIAAIQYAVRRQLAQMEEAATRNPLDLMSIFSRNLPLNDDDKIAMNVWLALWNQSSMNVELAEVQRGIHQEYLRFFQRTLTAAGVASDKITALAQSERLLAFINGISIQVLQDASHWSSERQIKELEYLLCLLFPG